MRSTTHLLSCCLYVALVANLALLPGSLATQPHRNGYVYVEGSYLMLNGERFIAKGYNYLPRDYGWTDMAEWDWEEVDREFALARAYGANTIRTGLNAAVANGDLTCASALNFREVRPDYLEAVNRLVGLAEKHDLRLILWLGDLCNQYLQPAYYPGLQRYIESIVPLFADHPSILAWDLETDIDGGILQRPSDGGCYGEVPYCTKAHMLNMLRFMADTIRSLDQNHLITVGFCWPTTSLLAQDFTDFLMPQFFGGDAPNILESDGAAQLEGYGWGAGQDRETMTRTLEDKIRYLQSHLTRPMPIVLGEYGSPSAGDDYSPEFQQVVYDVYLDVAFLRFNLAGALNWALTDFTWPPRAEPFAFREQPLPVTEQNCGAFRLDYSPKPAAEIARVYYADFPVITFQEQPEELTFLFSKTFVPGPEDTRVLAVAFDTITFLDEGGTPLLKLDIGDPSARPYLAQGFSGDEGPWAEEAENFVWAGGEERTARVLLPFPEGTHAISLRVNSGLEDMQMTALVEDREIESLPVGIGWRTYTVELPEEQPLAVGGHLGLRGKFNLPVSEGTVTIQISGDQSTWQDIASLIPARGRFAVSVPIERAGSLWLRAIWSGAGLYQPATSDAVLVEIPAPPATSTPAVVPLPAPSSPTPVAESGPGVSIGPYVGVGVVLLLLAGLGAHFVRRRR